MAKTSSDHAVSSVSHASAPPPAPKAAPPAHHEARKADGEKPKHESKTHDAEDRTRLSDEAADDARKPGDPEDPSASENGEEKPTEEQQSIDDLKSQIEELKNELAAMKQEQAQEGGGDSGGGDSGGGESGGAPPAQQAAPAQPAPQGQNDVNTLLQQDVMMLQQAMFAGPKGAQMKQQAFMKLMTDYSQARQTGAPINPQVDMLVQQALRSAGGAMNMGMGGFQKGGFPMTSSFGMGFQMGTALAGRF